ncbi:hypothetical protein H6501_04105 [Candidatus Woesearchaeota archaeon]|nr:hypothetical protein [Nanoarchaeota archaeon]MCB9370756.1 hypothetical protein [Candidatus Woesearchaeota archaeon]
MRLAPGTSSHASVTLSELCFFFDFEEAVYGEREYDIGYLHYRLEFSEEDLKYVVLFTDYDLWKILYYAVLVGIRKVANSPEDELRKRIEKLGRMYENLEKLTKLRKNTQT